MNKVNYYDFIDEGKYLAYPNKENPKLLILLSDFSSFRIIIGALKLGGFKFKIFRYLSFLFWFFFKFLYINKLGNVANAQGDINGCLILFPYAGDEKLTKISLDCDSSFYVEKIGWGAKKKSVMSEYNTLKKYLDFTPKVYDLVDLKAHCSFKMTYIETPCKTYNKAHFDLLTRLMRSKLKAEVEKSKISDLQFYKNLKEIILGCVELNDTRLKKMVLRCIDVLDMDEKLYDQYTCHGDFTESNIVFDGSSLQVIDWEHSFVGLPFFEDKYHYLVKNFNSNFKTKIINSIDCLTLIYFIYFIIKVGNLSLLNNDFVSKFDLDYLQ